MMDFINPHAILVRQENVAEILSTVAINHRDLFELIDESRAENARYYIVAWRDSVTGAGQFKTYTEPELACEYRLGAVSQFWGRFTKI